MFALFFTREKIYRHPIGTHTSLNHRRQRTRFPGDCGTIRACGADVGSVLYVLSFVASAIVGREWIRCEYASDGLIWDGPEMVIAVQTQSDGVLLWKEAPYRPRTHGTHLRSLRIGRNGPAKLDFSNAPILSDYNVSRIATFLESRRRIDPSGVVAVTVDTDLTSEAAFQLFDEYKLDYVLTRFKGDRVLAQTRILEDVIRNSSRSTGAEFFSLEARPRGEWNSERYDGFGFHLAWPRRNRDDIFEFRVPYWFLMGVGLLPFFLYCARQIRQSGRKSGVCRICGYDLRATPQRCPECGTSVPRT